MVKSILVQKKTLHFKEIFEIAYEKVMTTDIVIVKIEDEAGNYGLGSASPDSEVTKETADSVYRLLSRKLNKKFFSYPILDWYKYHEKIQNEFCDSPSAAQAAEEAVLNLFAAQNKISLTTIFGGYRETCPIVMTIGVKPVDKTLLEVKKRISENYKIIKLKGGLNLKEDILKIQKINKFLPKGFELVLDANQGYSLAEAKNLLVKIKNSKVKLIEQPIKAKNINGLKILNKISKIPIIADEAVVNIKDVVRLLSGDYAAGVNIKLMKCGGPINFLKIFHLAKSLNKIVMIGCMYESQISITTGARLALALPIDYIDLDSGNLDFADDPAIGGAVIKDGSICEIKPLKLR